MGDCLTELADGGRALEFAIVTSQPAIADSIMNDVLEPAIFD